MTQYLEHLFDRLPSNEVKVNFSKDLTESRSTCWIRGEKVVVLNETRDASLLCSGRLEIKQDPIVSDGCPNATTPGSHHLN